ncbi:MAG TPA: hypothetical protein VIJ79_04090 [Acidobacteriaceae bacterium]
MTPAPTPRRSLNIFILLAALSSVFLDYWEYSRTFHADPDIWASTLCGAAPAPAQYRIGVLKAAAFLTLHTPLAMRHALALIDLIALLIAAFVLRALLTRSDTWRSASVAAQWFAAAAFLLLFEYSLQWLTWYQRPETLTIAALLALSLWLSTHRLPGPAGTLLTAASLIALGILQGFTRADVGVVFYVSIALICLFSKRPQPDALPRWTQFSASLIAAACAAAVQLYLMRIVYPHATYGSTPVYQLTLNLTDRVRIVPFALILAPTLWLAIPIARRRFAPQPAQAGLLLASAIFVCLWFTLGSIDEVRIFLPFALALTPLTVEAATARIAVHVS